MAESLQHGAQKQFYVVFTTPAKGMDAVLQSRAAHLDYQASLEKRGAMFAAGPFREKDDDKSWTGEGMIILRAKSLAEAKEMAAGDPMHKSGARSFIVRPWVMNEGGISLRVFFGEGKVEAE